MLQEVKRLTLISAGILALVLIAGISSSAVAATLCVDPGKPGCHATIGDAVSHAASGDIIAVSQGTYKEAVVIGKSLSLIGKNPANTIIDATGLPNGVYVDGIDHPGLTHVVVAGFTIINANFEGILVTNASYVTLQGNRIRNNDRSLDVVHLTCPGLPSFETAEDFDCGEGVHVSGMDHSSVLNNTMEGNSGGILISDETGPTHDNLVAGNIARNNLYDCGITIPSHPPVNATAPFGIYRNAILGNEVSGNGVLGEGAGIGLFAFLQGGRVSENLIAANRITGNGLPGVTFHAHGPFENLDNNVITGNYIAGNGADTDDAFTPGRAGINIYGLSPINNLVISLNVIKDEDIDIAIHTPAEVHAQWNNLNSPGTGVANLGTSPVVATRNWWGCANGPNSSGCSTVSGPNVQVAPWLSSPAVPNGSPNAQH